MGLYQLEVGVITPINGLINKFSWGYFTLHIGVCYFTPVITIVGTHLVRNVWTFAEGSLTNWATKKTLLLSIILDGLILIMVYYNALYNWIVFHPLYNPTNQGFFHCSTHFATETTDLKLTNMGKFTHTRRSAIQQLLLSLIYVTHKLCIGTAGQGRCRNFMALSGLGSGKENRHLTV